MFGFTKVLINYFGLDTIVANGSLPKVHQRSYNSNITLRQVFGTWNENYG
jgi:hypothetical protein